MNCKEKREFIEKLGWKIYDTWANRDFYALEGYTSKFYLVEHYGFWSIGRGEDFYYIEDPTVEEIAEYTELAKNYFNIAVEPETHTVKELIDVITAIKEFYNRFVSEEEEEEFNI